VLLLLNFDSAVLLFRVCYLVLFVLAGRDHRQFLVQLLTRKSEEEDFKETDALYSNHQEAETTQWAKSPKKTI